MKVMLNGTIVDASKAVISVYDHGFLYGMGLFETFRTYGKKPYLLERHLNRMRSGCEQLGIPCTLTEQDVSSYVEQLLVVNGLTDGYVRVTVSAGAGELGLPQDDYTEPTILILVKKLPPSKSPEQVVDGRQLRLLSTRRNTPESEVRFKSLHYMNNILAKRELERLKLADQLEEHDKQLLRSLSITGVEGLMLTSDRHLAEGIVSNVFFVKDNKLYTPSIETGILPGITRQRVLELAESAHITCKQGLYSWDDLLDADEVWITNSIQELVPVYQLVDGAGKVKLVGNGLIGSVTKRLLAAYQADTLK